MFMTSHHDQLLAVLIVLAVFAVIGFVGWYTAEPEVVKYQIRVEKIERPKYVRT